MYLIKKLTPATRDRTGESWERKREGRRERTGGWEEGRRGRREGRVGEGRRGGRRGGRRWKVGR
jgi:hypothetical protein